MLWIFFIFVFDLMFFYCKNKASANVGSSQRVGAPPACMRYKKRTNLEIELFLYLEKGWKKAQPFGWAFYTAWMRLKKRTRFSASSFYTLKRVEKKPNLSVELFIPCDAVKKKTDFSVDLFIPWMGWKKEPNLRWALFIPWKRLKKKVQQKLNLFYTPKRFRTAVAGMKIPSPGPLDDRGVLVCAKYRCF